MKCFTANQVNNLVHNRTLLKIKNNDAEQIAKHLNKHMKKYKDKRKFLEKKLITASRVIKKLNKRKKYLTFNDYMLYDHQYDLLVEKMNE